MKVLVTGASGFIGSAFVVRALGEAEHSVVALVRNSDQRNQRRLYSPEREGVIRNALFSGRLRIVFGDLLNGQDISGLTEGCDAVVNFAARTFVDHSIRDPLPFLEANVMGTYRLLEDARRNGIKQFIQISTDEVYGAILKGAYKEDARPNPTNPYAASKLGADALAISYAHTFGLHTTVTRTENNYGPYQHPQKVFPTFVKKALAGEKLPIYGDGQHVRQWLWVDDHVDAILFLLGKTDRPAGEVYHVAGNQELKNIELAQRILQLVDEIRPHGLLNDSLKKRVEFLSDHNIRPGHDRRYALNCDKLRWLGWEPQVGLVSGISRAVAWYAHNEWWLQ